MALKTIVRLADLSSGFITNSSASSTYLTQASALSTYITQASASTTYAPLESPTLSGSVIFLNSASFYYDGTGRDSLFLNNNNIVNVGNISIADPGPNEGISWSGGNLWKIYESPDDLASNTAGNLQFVQNTTRRLTLDTSGNATFTGAVSATTFTGALVPRETTTAYTAAPAPNMDTTDFYTITAASGTITFGAPTGTLTDGRKLMIRIKDNGTARTLAWNAIYRASLDLTLPTTTLASKTLYLGFIYNATDTKWDLISRLGNF